METKTIPLESKLKVGDIFLFIASALEQGKQISNNAFGSAVISDYHKSDESYNIVIWDYKGQPKAGVGKGAILDIKETTGLVIATPDNVTKERAFVIMGGHRDKNLNDFVEELKEDLGEGSGQRPVFLVIKEIKESNVLELLRSGGLNARVNEQTGKLEI